MRMNLDIMNRSAKFLLCLAVSMPAMAAFKSPQEANSALRFRQDCQWQVAQGSDCRIEQVVTILRDSGRDAFGTATLVFRERETLTLLRAYTRQPDGTELAVPDGDIQRGTMPGQNGFESSSYLTVAFPAVRTGSTVVLEYRRQTPRIAPFEALSQMQGLSAGSLRIDEFDWKIRADQPLHWAGRDLAGRIEVTQSADRKTLAARSVQPMFFDVTETGNRFELRSLPLIDVSTEADPLRYLAPIATGFAQRLAEPLPAQAVAAVAMVQGKPWQQRLAGLMADVNTRIRYMGDWRISENGYLPFTLAQIEQRGFGDCKDMALTLAAMLRASGLQAQVALVRADVDNTPLLLSPQNGLNHAIVRLQVEGQTYWLDPTQKLNVLQGPVRELQDRSVFVLADDGKVATDRIPLMAAASSYNRQQLDFSPQDGRLWQLKAEGELAGSMARQILGVESMQGKERQDNVLAEALLSNGMTKTQHLVQRTAVPALLAEPYHYTVDAKVGQVTKPLGAFRLLDLRQTSGRIATWRQWQAKAGVTDYLMEASNEQSVTRVHDVKPLAQPASCEVRSPWADYTLKAVPVKNGVGLAQQWVRKALWLSADTMRSAEFGRFVDQLEECDGQAQILLQK